MKQRAAFVRDTKNVTSMLKDKSEMRLTETFPLLEGHHLHGFLKGSHVRLWVGAVWRRPAAMEAVRRFSPGLTWSPLGWKSVNPAVLLRAPVFYRRRKRGGVEMWHKHTIKGSHPSRWAVCVRGCRFTCAGYLTGHSHIYWWYWVLLSWDSRTDDGYKTRRRERSEGPATCEEPKRHMILMIRTQWDPERNPVPLLYWDLTVLTFDLWPSNSHAGQSHALKDHY